MTEPIRFRVGERVHVWIVNGYYPAAVLGHHPWTHSSGNTFVAYKVDAGSGVMHCSANSIKEFVGD
jgi:hypothetical protein